MPRSLPADVLAIVANYSEKSTLTVLVRVSSTVRAVSLRPLYTSIDVVESGSMTQCLVTLAENTDIAALVQELHISCGSIIPCELSEIAARALEQVVNLTILRLILPYDCATSKIFARARFRLRDFVCDLESDLEYPIARFLESQPEITSLFLSRHCESLLGLEASALPVLSTLFGPLSVLRDILPGRIARMKRIGCQNQSSSSRPVHDIREFTEVLRGAQIKPDGNAPISILIGVELGSFDATSAIETALSGLGDQAPWIGSLGIVLFGLANQIEEMLSIHLGSVLGHFPTLQELVLVSLSPSQSGSSSPATDPLCNSAQQKNYLVEWRIAQPALGQVRFPNAAYKYTKRIYASQEEDKTSKESVDSSYQGEWILFDTL